MIVAGIDLLALPQGSRLSTRDVAVADFLVHQATRISAFSGCWVLSYSAMSSPPGSVSDMRPGFCAPMSGHTMSSAPNWIARP